MPAAARLTGRGDYMETIKKVLGYAKTAKDVIDVLAGHGDYTVKKNAISMGASVPTFKNGGDGVRVCHREYLGDVAGSTGFNLQAFDINPGLPGTFPWLAQIAQNFEEYVFEGLVFEYRPTSGTVAGTSGSAALGVVVMATNYDVLDPPFNGKIAMEDYEFSTSNPPYEAALHPVECARGLNVTNSLFVRQPGGAPTDLQLYDLGMFQIATIGQQQVYPVGELWVSYDILLKRPKLAIGTPLGFQLALSSQACTDAAALGVPLATPLSKVAWGLAGIYPDPSVLSDYLFTQVGTFMVTTYWWNTGAAMVALPTPTFGGALSLAAPLSGNTYSSGQNASRFGTSTGGISNSGDAVVSTCVVNVNAPGTSASNRFYYAGQNGLGAGCNADTIIQCLSFSGKLVF